MNIYIYHILRGDFEEMPKCLITYKLNNFWFMLKALQYRSAIFLCPSLMPESALHFKTNNIDTLRSCIQLSNVFEQLSWKSLVSYEEILHAIWEWLA